MWIKLYYKDKERGGLHSLSTLLDPSSRTQIAQTLVRAVRSEADLMVVSKVDRLLTDAVERYR